jgi:hypothetical protein
MSGRGRGRGRGRGKSVAAATATTTVSPESVPEEPVKKRASKKQFSVVAVVTPNSIEGNLQPETRKPLIAYLPIQSRDIVFHDVPIQYNPAPPTNVEPYDATIDNPFMEEAESLTEGLMALSSSMSSMPATVEPTVHAAIVEKAGIDTTAVVVAPDYYKKATLLVQFQTSEEIRTIPDRTSVACFWCCHSFDWKPVVLPVRDQGEYIQVQGNFCCPECAMAHLFESKQDSYARWEQLSLLNRIYSTGNPIRPAPVKQILKLFGGPLTIDEYRGMIRNGKLRVDIHLPPMVSLLATMDTKPIDFYDVSLTKNVMETVKERLAKAEEVLKLKRTKPLKAWESTLDACINLKVRN